MKKFYNIGPDQTWMGAHDNLYLLLDMASFNQGTSMMVPQYLPKPEHLVDVLNGDYGSLHVQRVPAVRHGKH